MAGATEAGTGGINRAGPETDKQLVHKPEEEALEAFRGYAVAEFKHLLRVKLTPKNEYLCLPVLSHDRTLKLPKEYDTTTVWCLCTSIGRILESGGVSVKKTTQPFGLFCDKPMTPGQCNMVVKRLVDYLIESGL
ncbi:hypothetical protein Bca4012_030771 [Brassica carinata]